MKPMRYLFLSSHTDDHELSCGGTIQKLISEGHQVHCEALSSCGNSDLIKEFNDAHEVLGVESMQRQVHNFKVREFTSKTIADFLFDARYYFDHVFTHSPNDRHDDHRIVAEQARRVLNCNLTYFMCPFNGELLPNYFVEISERQLQKKIEALACYKSQAYRSYMNPEFIEAQARVNGIKCGKLYAEAFKVERLVF